MPLLIWHALLVVVTLGCTVAEKRHSCVVYIDRDVVPDETFLRYIRDYQSHDHGGLTPSSDNLADICSFSPPYIEMIYQNKSLLREYVPCAAAAMQSVCYDGRLTEFFPVRSHDPGINGSQKERTDYLHDAFQAVDAPPGVDLPDVLLKYSPLVQPGINNLVDHVFIFFIGTNPWLVANVVRTLSSRWYISVNDYTVVFHPVVTPSPYISEFDFGRKSIVHELLLESQEQSESESGGYDVGAEAPPEDSPPYPSLLFIDADPLTNGELLGTVVPQLLLSTEVAVAQWEDDAFSRAFLSGFSHGLRAECKTCSIAPVVLPRSLYEQGDPIACMEEIALQTGSSTRSVVLPPFPSKVQCNRELLHESALHGLRTHKWDSMFFHTDYIVIQEDDNVMTLTNILVGLLENFTKHDIMRGGRQLDMFYSRPQAIPLFTLWPRVSQRVQGALVALMKRYNWGFSNILQSDLRSRFDWLTGLAILEDRKKNSGRSLGAAVGDSWLPLEVQSVAISPYAVLLVAYDFSSFALYHPLRHTVMEVRSNLGRDASLGCQLVSGKSFSLTYIPEKHTVLATGPFRTGPHSLGSNVTSVCSLHINVKFLSRSNDKLCNTFSHSCLGTWEHVGIIPVPLYGHTAVHYKGYLYIYGGTLTTTEYVQNTLYRAKIHSLNDWEVVSTAGPHRSFHSSLLYTNESGSPFIYSLGSTQVVTGALAVYSIDDDQWLLPNTNLPTTRRPCMFSIDNSIYVLGRQYLYRYEPTMEKTFSYTSGLDPNEVHPCTRLMPPPTGYPTSSSAYWRSDTNPSKVELFASLTDKDNTRAIKPPPDNALIAVFQDGTESVSIVSIPKNIQCSADRNEVPAALGCEPCTFGYIADGVECVPCDKAVNKSDVFHQFCHVVVPRVYLENILAPVAAVLLVFIVLVLLWYLRRRRRDVAHQRRCNAPSSGGVFVVYFWVDKAPQLWKERSNDMAEVSSQLVQLLRCVLARHECYEVVNCGDSGLFTGRDAERVLRASSEAWLQVAQRQWCVGKLRANFLLHYDDFQCVETEVDSEHSGFWRWVESGRRARTAMTLVGGGIQHLQRTAMYVQGIVGSARFLGEYARARGDELAPLAAYLCQSESEANTAFTRVPSVEWQDCMVFPVLDPSLHTALLPEPYRLSCCTAISRWLKRYRHSDFSSGAPNVWLSQKVGLDIVREHGMLSECGTAMGTSAPTAEEARRRYPLVGLVKGDTVLTTYEVLLQGDVAPRHVRLPLRCFEVNAMMTVTPRCKHSPECATDETFARLLCDRDALTAEERELVGRYQCEHCARCVPKRVRLCRLDVMRPMPQGLPSHCPFFQLSVSTHRVTLAARLAEERRQNEQLELLQRARRCDNRPGCLSDIPPELWPACESRTSETPSTNDVPPCEDVYVGDDILLHPMVTNGLLPPELFVHVVRIVEKLYDALLLPLRADERLEVAESVRQQLRLFTETYPDSPERVREVALRLLQVMDMLHVKDIVEQIVKSKID